MTAAVAIFALATIQPFTAASHTIETLQPGFGQTIVALHRAESAGATSSEIAELVVLLNKALELNVEALKLGTPYQRRADLLAQVDQILRTVENRAAELAAAASQRTHTNRVLTYVWGPIAAVLGTIVYAFAGSLCRKYRIKRTFQMKVTRK